MPQMLRPPSVGPIVGHTTDTRVRLWIRSADVPDLRTVGVAALYERDQPEPQAVRYFRLHREYDRTGTVDFDGLKPNTRYTARLGWVSVDSLDSELIVDDQEVFERLPEESVWKEDFRRLDPDEAEARFTTFPSSVEGGFSFLMGSCRYPGIMGESKRSDEIFQAMHRHVEQARGKDALPPRFVLMVGDQIYADKLNRAIPLGRADTWREFQERYTDAFSTPYIRQLMRSLPTYMILDDHEIEDNWTQARLKDALKRDLFHNAIRAYMSYQWVHGPRNFDKRIHYSFEYAQVPFFVLDVRTQRIRDDSDAFLRGNHLLGYPAKASAPGFKGQLDQLCDWLVEMQQLRGNVPKFVVSPSVFAPNDVGSRGGGGGSSDSWPAFPETRRRVLRTIVDNNVQNVVFLSGDVHCSNVSEIFFETRGGRTLPLKAFSIVSSAFYWPFPFADGDPLGFVHDSKAEEDGFDVDGSVTMHYRSRGFEQDDNFTQVTYDTSRNALVVQNYNRKGKALKSPNELELAR